MKIGFLIIINSNFQNKGFGLFLLEELKSSNFVLNGWVIDHQNDFKKNGDHYIFPLIFYTKARFIVNQNIRLENEKISCVKISWNLEYVLLAFQLINNKKELFFSFFEMG
jgi:hypothetical protein